MIVYPDDVIQDRYRVVREVGSGRTSKVYLCEDTQVGREVVIKGIRREYLTANPDATMRFMREGATLKQIEHPAIIKVYDTVQLEEDSFIVMEYLSGGTLEYKLTVNGPLSISEMLRLLAPIAEALGFLHKQKILHRDLTPMNIMLDGVGQSRLMDFNVAKMGHLSPLTLKGAMMGTAAYKSPELLMERSRENVKTEMWGFGMTIYKALAGELPYTLKKPNDVMKMASNPPKSITTYRDDVPPDMVDLLEAMLRVEPDTRLADMSTVAQRMRAIVLPES